MAMVSQLELGELGEEGMLFVYPAGSSPVLAVVGSTPSGLIHLEARHCQGNRYDDRRPHLLKLVAG
jgi:hypothetical protein